MKFKKKGNLIGIHLAEYEVFDKLRVLEIGHRLFTVFRGAKAFVNFDIVFAPQVGNFCIGLDAREQPDHDCSDLLSHVCVGSDR